MDQDDFDFWLHCNVCPIGTVTFKEGDNVVPAERVEELYKKLREDRTQSIAKWRDAFEKMHQRAMKAEKELEKLKAAE